MIFDAQRIPTWLREEVFMVKHNPRERPPIRVSVWKDDLQFEGRGFSIAHAAKEARKKREGK